jgi:hypothetical protein
MEITVNLPEELATRLQPHREQLPKILELGLRELYATALPGFKSTAEILETLAALPTPEEILALRPSKTLQKRINVLLEKNREEGLTPDEEKEWEHFQYLEHLVRIAKAKAYMKLKNA